MSGFAEWAEAGVRRETLPIGEVTIALAVCVATVAGVGSALVVAPAGMLSTVLPIFVLGVVIMFGLGLIDLVRRHDVRFARAVIVAGVLWSLSALSASTAPALYAIGHISQWFVELAVVYLLLSHPSGRLRSGTQRAVFAGGALVVGLLFIPTALLTQQFVHPSLWSGCQAGCPANLFFIGHATPGLVHGVLVPLREGLAVTVFAAVAVVAVQSVRTAGPMLAQLYAPIAAVAILQAIAFAVYFPIRASAPASEALTTVSWIVVLSLPAIVLASGAGRVYRRAHAANALDRIARDLVGGTRTPDVRLALAAALEDPSLRILHSFPGNPHGWVDESGAPAELAQAAAKSDRITEVSSGGWHIALLHDAALAEDRALVQSAASYALAALENRSLTDELHHSIDDLARSRASRLTAEHDTRQKIERDLHDGAQQRLVALRLKLGLAASGLERRDPASAEVLRGLGEDVDATIDEVRSLARGIYPPLLAQTGLRDALRAAAREAALPTTVSAEAVGRYNTEIEAAVYFSCSEALQNAAKHARAATGVTISVWEHQEKLHFEVNDDGAGFDTGTTPYGTGLGNLGDRLAAVGGTISVCSSPGQGTALAGSIPLA
jgi:signal transduction histidine kinase